MLLQILSQSGSRFAQKCFMTHWRMHWLVRSLALGWDISRTGSHRSWTGTGEGEKRKGPSLPPCWEGGLPPAASLQVWERLPLPTPPASHSVRAACVPDLLRVSLAPLARLPALCTVRQSCWPWFLQRSLELSWPWLPFLSPTHLL